MCVYVYIYIYIRIYFPLSLSLLSLSLSLTPAHSHSHPHSHSHRHSPSHSLSLSLSPWLSMFLCFLHVCLQAVILITSDSVANLAPPPRAPLHAPFTSHPLESHPPIRGKSRVRDLRQGCASHGRSSRRQRCSRGLSMHACIWMGGCALCYCYWPPCGATATGQ